MISRTLPLALLLLAGAANAQPQRAPAGHVQVIDGDTIRLDGETIRLRGLDAPELHGRCAAEIALAIRATERLRQIVAAGVTIERGGSDRYRRTLATVRTSQGRDVAMILIQEGLARPYDGRGQRQGWCW
jgi:endonuclease YncB( thermonuclease family)